MNISDSYFAEVDDDDNIIYDIEGRTTRDHEREVSFRIEPLLSYKINPFTVFFLGFNLGGQKDPYPDREGLTRTSQSLFLKFQYFIRG